MTFCRRTFLVLNVFDADNMCLPPNISKLISIPKRTHILLDEILPRTILDGRILFIFRFSKSIFSRTTRFPRRAYSAISRAPRVTLSRAELRSFESYLRVFTVEWHTYPK